MTLRPRVLEDLRGHGVEPGPHETPEMLRERLNEVYLGAVRALKARLVNGEIPKADYSRHVAALRDSFPLLGFPVTEWTIAE